MLEDTIKTALDGALVEGCDDDTATVFAVCAVLAEKPDMALPEILNTIESVRQHRPAQAV
ncbi:MAG: hypothetical protein AAF495_13160 [Pseudomonadota bacterium]